MRFLGHETRQDLKCLVRLLAYPALLVVSLICVGLNFAYRRTENKTLLIGAFAILLMLHVFWVIRYRPGACADRSRSGMETVGTSFVVAILSMVCILIILLYLIWI
jgi:hypothetical protein